MNDFANADLRNAARDGELEVVRGLLEMGLPGDADEKSFRQSPLCLAAEAGHADVCELLIENGARVNGQGQWRMLAHRTSRTPWQVILKSIDLVNSRAPDGKPWGVFLADLAQYQEGMVETINRYCPDPVALWNAVGPMGETPLASVLSENVTAEQVPAVLPHIRKITPDAVMKAAQMDAPALDQMLAMGGDPLARSFTGDTALHHAAQNASHGAIRALVAAGADVNVQDLHGSTPLMAAENADTARLLLKLGADPSITNFDGASALHILMRDCENVREVLPLIPDLAKQATRTKPDGSTLLHMLAAGAMREADVEAILEVVGRGAINQINRAGQTPLHRAVSRDRGIDVLLRNGADPNLADISGETPLMEACRRTKTEVVMQLIAHGADPAMVSKAGDNAMDIVMRRKDQEVMLVLRSVEAQPHAMKDVAHDLLKDATMRALAFWNRTARAILKPSIRHNTRAVARQRFVHCSLRYLRQVRFV